MKTQTAVNIEVFLSLISLLKIDTPGVCEVDLRKYNHKKKYVNNIKRKVQAKCIVQKWRIN